MSDWEVVVECLEGGLDVGEHRRREVDLCLSQVRQESGEDVAGFLQIAGHAVGGEVVFEGVDSKVEMKVFHAEFCGQELTSATADVFCFVVLALG